MRMYSRARHDDAPATPLFFGLPWLWNREPGVKVLDPQDVAGKVRGRDSGPGTIWVSEEQWGRIVQKCGFTCTCRGQ